MLPAELAPRLDTLSWPTTDRRCWRQWSVTQLWISRRWHAACCRIASTRRITRTTRRQPAASRSTRTASATPCATSHRPRLARARCASATAPARPSAGSARPDRYYNHGADRSRRPAATGDLLVELRAAGRQAARADQRDPQLCAPPSTPATLPTCSARPRSRTSSASAGAGRARRLDASRHLCRSRRSRARPCGPAIQALLEDARAGQVRRGRWPKRSTASPATRRTSPRSTSSCASPASGIVTLAEGEISELHVGLKGTMNALFLKDLADKTRRGLRGRVEAGQVGRWPATATTSCASSARRRADARRAPHQRGRGRDRPPHLPRLRRRQVAARDRLAAQQGGRSRPARHGLGADHHPRQADRGTGILNNELYIGRLVWNRLRYIKDPETGKRVSRPNPAKRSGRPGVPELRIVDDDLWEAVKARQAALRSARNGTQRPGYWDRRRPRSLLSGLMKCGVLRRRGHQSQRRARGLRGSRARRAPAAIAAPCGARTSKRSSSKPCSTG